MRHEFSFPVNYRIWLVRTSKELNQPALVFSRQIVLDSSRSRPGMRFRPAGLFDLLQIKDGAKGNSLPCTSWEGDKFYLRFARGARNRAVGGTKVNADCRDPILRLPHSLYYSSSAVLDIG